MHPQTSTLPQSFCSCMNLTGAHMAGEASQLESFTAGARMRYASNRMCSTAPVTIGMHDGAVLFHAAPYA